MPSAAPPALPARPLDLRLVVVLLALAGLAAYGGSLAAPFVFDDPRPGEALVFASRPLTAASFAFDRWLGGSTTRSYHLFNLAVHVAAGTCLFLVLRDALVRLGRGSDRMALVVALLWLLHPLQTQAVQYLSQRAECLAGLFLLAALLALVGARGSGGLGLALLASALAMASKETGFVALPLLLLHDRTFLAGSLRAAWRARRGFYLALAALTLALGFWLVGERLFAADSTAGFGNTQHGALQHARAQPAVVLHYLWLVLWPVQLCLDPGWALPSRASEWLPQTLLALLALLWMLRALARGRLGGYLAAVFCLVLAPSSSFVPLADLAFEHRMYLAQAPVLVALAWLVEGGLARAQLARAAPLLAAALVLAALLRTRERNQDYRSAVELWQVTVACAPANPRAHSNLGHALLEEGRAAEAVAAFEGALAVEEEYAAAWTGLGSAWWRQRAEVEGALERAAEAHRQALELGPSPVSFHGLAAARLALGDERAAERGFRSALDLEPAVAVHHLGLGNALDPQGRDEEAVEAYRRALALDPQLAEAHTNLAAVLEELGKLEEALPHFRAARELNPASADAAVNLGRLLLRLERHDEALELYRAAARLAPEEREAHELVARLLLARPAPSASELAEAEQAAARALEIAGEREPSLRALLERARAARKP